jgi:TetR/AcrR family transcriptional repressor of nem operon
MKWRMDDCLIFQDDRSNIRAVMNPEHDSHPIRRRGRPCKHAADLGETRELLLRTGVELLTEQGFSSTGIDQILRRVGVPKGSFYNYFKSKEAFGAELIECYRVYFLRKLERHLGNAALSPLARLHAFIADAQQGMQKFDFSRGCLAGNLGQEMGTLPETYRAQLNAVFSDWQDRLARNFEVARAVGEIAEDADCQRLASFFWIGWEGAVMRAKLEKSVAPLEIFADGFFAGVARR